MSKSVAPVVPQVITVGGKTYPCRMTCGALRRFKRITGKDIQVLEEGDLDTLITLVWCMTASACRADGVEFDVDEEMFADCIDPMQLNKLFVASGQKKSPK